MSLPCYFLGFPPLREYTEAGLYPCEGSLVMDSLRSSILARVESSDPAYQRVIDEICNLNWADLNEEDIIRGVPGNRARNVS